MKAILNFEFNQSKVRKSQGKKKKIELTLIFLTGC